MGPRAISVGQGAVSSDAQTPETLEQMAEALPTVADLLRHIAARLVDLLPVIRNHVYHPDFRRG